MHLEDIICPPVSELPSMLLHLFFSAAKRCVHGLHVQMILSPVRTPVSRQKNKTLQDRVKRLLIPQL